MSQDPGIATLSEDNPGGASPSTECDVSAPNGVGEVSKDENEEKSRENEAAEEKDETENGGGAEETNNGSMAILLWVIRFKGLGIKVTFCRVTEYTRQCYGE